MSNSTNDAAPKRRGRPPGSKSNKKAGKKAGKKVGKKAGKKGAKRRGRPPGSKNVPAKVGKKAGKKAGKKGSKKAGKKGAKRRGRPPGSFGRKSVRTEKAQARDLVPLSQLPDVVLPKYPPPPRMPPGAGSMAYGTGSRYLGLTLDDTLDQALERYASAQRQTQSECVRYLLRLALCIPIRARRDSSSRSRSVQKAPVARTPAGNPALPTAAPIEEIELVITKDEPKDELIEAFVDADDADAADADDDEAEADDDDNEEEEEDEDEEEGTFSLDEDE